MGKDPSGFSRQLSRSFRLRSFLLAIEDNHAARERRLAMQVVTLPQLFIHLELKLLSLSLTPDGLLMIAFLYTFTSILKERLLLRPLTAAGIYL